MKTTIRYNPELGLKEVELLGEVCWAQQQGTLWGYWAEEPKPGEEADEVRDEDGEEASK